MTRPIAKRLVPKILQLETAAPNLYFRFWSCWCSCGVQGAPSDPVDSAESYDPSDYMDEPEVETPIIPRSRLQRSREYRQPVLPTGPHLRQRSRDEFELKTKLTYSSFEGQSHVRETPLAREIGLLGESLEVDLDQVPSDEEEEEELFMNV
jgi:hypothetical protein